jgi:SAM-dependent methyltransferase
MPLANWGVMHCEHLNRYYFASRLSSGKTVLDLASGEGYGSAILAKTAKKVIGVDIDGGAVRHASEKYAQNNLEFKQGDGCKIPIEGKDVFDLICSFETIEHIQEKDQILLIEEFGRLIKDDGLLIISSPNSDILGKDDNPHHLKELTFHEFDRILSDRFPHRLWYVQNTYYHNQITQMGEMSGSYHEMLLKVGGEGVETADISGKVPLFFICVASKSKFTSEPSNLFLLDLDSVVEKQLEAFTQSISWKITKPLRAVNYFLKKRRARRGK